MKKVFFRLLLASIGLIVAFSSCLDDGDGSSSTAENAFAYVSTTDAGTKIVYASYTDYGSSVVMVPLSTDALQTSGLNSGDCAFVSYKFDHSNLVGSSYYLADYINIDEERIFKREDQPLASSGVFNTSELEDDKVYFTSFPTSKSSNNLLILGSDLGDRWYLSYSYLGRESEQAPKLLVTFDEENYVENEEGNVFVDFQLQKQGPEVQGDLKTMSKAVVVNFSYLKSVLKQYRNSKGEVNVKFRYYGKKTNPAAGELEYELKNNSGTIVTYSFEDEDLEK